MSRPPQDVVVSCSLSLSVRLLRFQRGTPLEVRRKRVRDLVLDLLRAVPGQSVTTMTWLSDKSGIASIGVDLSAHHPVQIQAFPATGQT